MAEQYVGVKFTTLFEGVEFGYLDERKEIEAELNKLSERHLLYRNTGNISMRVPDGMVVTPSGVDMAKITKEDMVLVNGADEKAKIVRAVGPYKPSSETFMHWLILKSFPDVNAIVHFHDDALMESGKFMETKKAEHYGTVELAHAAVEAMKQKKFIILKKHGAVAAGKDMKSCDRMITAALKIVK